LKHQIERYCSSPSPARLVGWPTSQGIWCLASSPNWMKHTRKRFCDTWLHDSISHSGLSRLHRQWHGPKVANPTSHFPAQNWQFIIATLSRWLGCFRVEPRANILHQKRQNVPLPPPIDIFYLHVLEREEGGSKFKKKSSFSEFPAAAPLSVSLSTVASCHNHQSPRQLPPSSQSSITAPAPWETEEKTKTETDGGGDQRKKKKRKETERERQRFFERERGREKERKQQKQKERREETEEKTRR